MMEGAGVIDELDLLTSDDVASLLKVSPRWLRYAADRVPGRVCIGPRAVRWRRSVLQAWIDAGCPDRQEEAESGNPIKPSRKSRDVAENVTSVR
jgi:predicted DNA-binding transcriptional regulator AlpA